MKKINKYRCHNYLLIAIVCIANYGICLGQKTTLLEKIISIKDLNRSKLEYDSIAFNLKKIRFNEQIKVKPTYLLSGSKEKLTLKTVKGDTGRLTKDYKHHFIEFFPFKEGINGDSLTLFIEGEKEPLLVQSLLLSGSNSAPYGLKYCHIGKGLPYYFSIRMRNFPTKWDYVVSDVEIEKFPSQKIYVINSVNSPEDRLSSLAVVFGFPIISVGKNIRAYGGLGGGVERRFWKYQQYNTDYLYQGDFWALCSNTKEYAGGLYEAGLLYFHKKMVFDVGISTIKFKVFQLNAGFGFSKLEKIH